jgi:hypothetical protein
MLTLPDPVAAFLCSRQIARHTPAYLMLDGSGKLLDWGGELSKYGIDGLSRGELIQTQITHLAEMIPIDEEENSPLHFVKFGTLTADVHLFSTLERIWVVFLDVSTEAEQFRAIQQKRYELQLASEDGANDDEIAKQPGDRPNPLIGRDTELKDALAAVERAVESLRQAVDRIRGR